jgi:Family of unknown function (DUF6186)
MTSAGTLAGYVAIIAMMFACESVARRSGRVASLSQALSALARWRPVWFLVLIGWLWVGWHLFVRVHR